MGIRATDRPAFDTSQIDQYFEERLRAIGLGAEEIAGQSLPELRDSLEQVDAAIAHPEAFGVLNVKVTANAGLLVTAGGAESHFSHGILPLLLVRRREIVARIRQLEAIATAA